MQFSMKLVKITTYDRPRKQNVGHRNSFGTSPASRGESELGNELIRAIMFI